MAVLKSDDGKVFSQPPSTMFPKSPMLPPEAVRAGMSGKEFTPLPSPGAVKESPITGLSRSVGMLNEPTGMAVAAERQARRKVAEDDMLKRAEATHWKKSRKSGPKYSGVFRFETEFEIGLDREKEKENWFRREPSSFKLRAVVLQISCGERAQSFSVARSPSTQSFSSGW